MLRLNCVFSRSLLSKLPGAPLGLPKALLVGYKAAQNSFSTSSYSTTKSWSPKTTLFSPQNRRRVSIASKTRNPNFKKLEKADIDYFRSIIPKENVISTARYGGDATDFDLEKYNTPVFANISGKAEVVLFPTSTQQVSDIVRYCNEKYLAIVPQGGITGTLAGSMAVYDEIVINLSKMNKIRSLDKDSGALVCDSGCILEELNSYIGDYGLTMPLDLGAKGSCHIGGNISTNAGGIRYIKYGSLHGSVLGLEVVLPDGKILDNLSTLRKDSTGYDVKQLFIGAEGTLGVVTGVSIMAAKKPKTTNLVIMGMASYEQVMETFRKSRTHLLEILSAFEYCDKSSMDISVKGLEKPNPLEKFHNYYAIIETSGSNQDHDQEKIMSLFEDLQSSNTIEDGIMANDTSQISKLWELRESMIVAHTKYGATYTLDLSIPINKADDAVNDLKNYLEEIKVYDRTLPYDNSPHHVKCVTGFGHIGDGNLHLNVIVDKYVDKFTETLEKFVFDYVRNLKGSISAEHGVGLLKPDILHYSKPKEAIELMTIIKKAIDPKGIMNPYKVLPMA